MSTLKTHDLEDIVAVTPGGDESPGNLVRHVKDEHSFGTVVAHDPRPQGFANQPQVTVLWSKEPILVNISTQQINAKSKMLKAKWSVSKEEPTIYGDLNFFNGKIRQPELRGEEEYDAHDLSSEELQQLQQDADNVTLHQDGRIVVERRASEPPDYLRGPDGNFRSTYFRR